MGGRYPPLPVVGIPQEERVTGPVDVVGRGPFIPRTSPSFVTPTFFLRPRPLLEPPTLYLLFPAYPPPPPTPSFYLNLPPSLSPMFSLSSPYFPTLISLLLPPPSLCTSSSCGPHKHYYS